MRALNSRIDQNSCTSGAEPISELHVFYLRPRIPLFVESARRDRKISLFTAPHPAQNVRRLSGVPVVDVVVKQVSILGDCRGIARRVVVRSEDGGESRLLR